MEIMAFEVICRVTVMVVYLSGVQNLTYNGPVVWGVAVCVGVGMSFCKVPVSG